MTDDDDLVAQQLAVLRPTQMTVGYAEVSRKRAEWRQRDADSRRKFLAKNPLPAVRGPDQHYFIIDHHHLARALLEEGIATASLTLRSDLSQLAGDEFWTVMDHNQWVHPYDANGVRRNVNDLPLTLRGLADDPYRSLAAEVRRAGGYEKSLTPFAEFLWADFFRRRIPADLLHSDPAKAVESATELARREEAAHLPDWSPPQGN